MEVPHRIEDEATEHAPLNRDVKRLVMRVADDVAPFAALAFGFAAEKLLGRSGAVAKKRRLGNRLDGNPPIRQPQAVRGRGGGGGTALHPGIAVDPVIGPRYPQPG